MDPPPSYPQLLKGLVSAARHSDGPTLFSIYLLDSTGKCGVHEQMPDGQCKVWPETFGGRCQAEAFIYESGQTKNWDSLM